MNARPNVPDWQHAENRKAAETLRSEGYRIEYSATGYQVWAPDGKYLGGGVTASGRCHGRYREANTRDFLVSALSCIPRHPVTL